jgi:hypothetical protein
MQKKITLWAFIAVLMVCFGGALLMENSIGGKIGKIDYSNRLTVVKEDGQISDNVPHQKTDIRYSPVPSDAIPGLDNYMDYQTNGNSPQEILAFGDTVIVCIAYCDSLDAPNANAGTTLRSRYNYSINGGVTWQSTTGIDLSNNQKSRYPDLFTMLSTGSTTVGTGGRIFDPPATGTIRRGGVARDLLLGIGAPDAYTLPWTGVTGNSDAFVHRRFDGKIGVVISPNSTDSVAYTTWDPATQTFTSRTHVFNFNPALGNTVSSYTIGASQIADHMTIASMYINEPANGGDNYRSVRMITSTNNGTSWSTPVKYAFNASTPNVLGGDSCQAYWHEDVAYKPGTSTPYLVFSTYPYVWNGTATTTAVEENKGWKIMIQSPGINGGAAPVTIADWHNIPILSDLNLYNQIVKFQINSALLSHPSVGFSQDGNTIWVAYSVIQKDTCVGYAVTFNYFDVYVQKSTDGGLTWSTPQNVTNTTNVDEMYPIVAETGNNTNYPYLIYQSDNIPGCHAFTDLQTVDKVYEVFKSTIIGIKNVSNEVPAVYSLEQNFPNPFNPTTTIRFNVSKSSNATLKVYDITGKLVATLFENEAVTPGKKEIVFNSTNLSSGIYFYTLSAGDFKDTKKMILVK